MSAVFCYRGYSGRARQICVRRGASARAQAVAVLRGLLRLDQFLDLSAELRSVLMTMNRHGVLYRCIDKFFLGIGRDRNGTVHFARILAAVDEHSRHVPSRS